MKKKKTEPTFEATLRIPADQFAFIEMKFKGTQQDIVDQYRYLTSLVNAGQGLSDKEFNACIDEYLKTGTLINGTELYAQMNLKQQDTFQTLKRAFKRIAYDERNDQEDSEI